MRIISREVHGLGDFDFFRVAVDITECQRQSLALSAAGIIEEHSQKSDRITSVLNADSGVKLPNLVLSGSLPLFRAVPLGNGDVNARVLADDIFDNSILENHIENVQAIGAGLFCVGFRELLDIAVDILVP